MRIAETPSRSMPETEFKVAEQKETAFTLALANWYVGLPHFEGERDLQEGHVKYLATEMENGRFLIKDAGLSVALCKWDRVERKLNGQHTCFARAELPAEWQPLIRVTKYEVGTEDEYRMLYARFDRNKTRSRSHITNIYLVNTPEYPDVSKSQLKALSEAFGFWLNYKAKSCRARHNGEKIAEMLRYPANVKVAHRVLPLIKKILCDQEYPLKRAPVLAAMFETFSKCVEDSEEFWEEVITGEMIKKTDPSFILREYLSRHVLSSVDANTTAKCRKVSAPEMYNVCIKCFNSYRAGDRLSKTPIAGAKRATVI